MKAAIEDVVAREKLATWMRAHGFATGHGDTLEMLLSKVTTSHLNLTRSLADVERDRDVRVEKWVADQLPRYGKIQYAGTPPNSAER